MLQVHDHFQTVVLKPLDGFIGHQQVFFRRRLQGPHHIQQPGFDHHHRDRNPLLVAGDELHVGPIADLCAAAARSAEQSQLHGSRIRRLERVCQLTHKLVGSGKADLSIANAKGGHALQQPDGIGRGYIDVRLLHPVPKAGVEQLDLARLSHWMKFPLSR